MERRLRMSFLLEVWYSLDAERLHQDQVNQMIVGLGALHLSDRVLRKAIELHTASDSNYVSIWDCRPPPDPLPEPLKLQRTTDQWINEILLRTLSPKDLAAVMTWSEWSLFSSVPSREFLNKRATKPAESPHYQQTVEHFNRVSLWIRSNIVLEPLLDKRAALLQKFIATASELRRQQNFSGLAQITFSLSSPPISRLKETWALLSAAEQTVFTDLCALTSPIHNFAVLREAIRQATPPLLPPLFLTTKDLTALEEASATWNTSGQLNWEKLKRIGESIRQTIICLQSPFLIPQDFSFELATFTSFAQFLQNPQPLVSEDRIQTLSILCQPILHT
jgi:hypothetical protein